MTVLKYWDGSAWVPAVVGRPGPSNNLAIGAVTNGATAAATITGSSPNQTLNLVLPQGIQGISFANIDGGAPNSNYGGITNIDCGGPV